MRIGAEGSPAPAPSLLGRQEEAGRTETAIPTSLGRGEAGPGDRLELSPETQKQLAELKARDQHVRAHEAAHLAAGGSLVRGGATYSYQQGPDGRLYAVGGEVSLDASSVPEDPQATLAKAERLRAAAMAPSDPSGQDRAVAARAAAMAAQASVELAKTRAPAESGETKGIRLDVLG